MDAFRQLLYDCEPHFHRSFSSSCSNNSTKQIQETFQWVAFGVYGFTVLYLIFMREVAFKKTYDSLAVWMRTVWNFSFIASAFGAISMFIGNTHWTLF